MAHFEKGHWIFDESPCHTQTKPPFAFYTLFLAYICAGIISVLPGASLLLLAENTQVSLAIAGSSYWYQLGPGFPCILLSTDNCAPYPHKSTNASPVAFAR